MLSPIFQSSTLSVRRQATAFIRAAAVVGNANPTTSTSTNYSTTATRPASTYTSTSFVVSQLQNNKNINNNHRRWFSSDTTGTGKTTTATEGTSEEDKEDNDAVAEEEDGTTTTTTTAEEGETTAQDENNEQEVQKLKKELVDLKNQLLRSFAEQENIRNIARNDVKAAKDFSTKSFAKSMLEVADNLDRALESVVTSPSPPDETTDEDSSNETDTLKSFVEGIQLTNSGLLKALQSNGVEAYCEQPGDIFNPDQHQALMEYLDPDPTKAAGTIGVVMKKGYTLNKRVLRPAEVGVIKK